MARTALENPTTPTTAPGAGQNLAASTSPPPDGGLPISVVLPIVLVSLTLIVLVLVNALRAS